MFVTHLFIPLGGAPGLTGLAARAGSVLAEGNASTLFAVVGGCSLVLASRARIARGDRRGAVVQALTRGALVTAIGLLLGFIPTTITVVLVPLGLAMMIAAPLLLVRSRYLIAVVVVLAATGGWINAQVRFALQIVMEIGGPSPLDLLHPVVLARGLLLTGTYPLITWVPYLLTGIVLVRTLLTAIDRGRERDWAVRALLVGAVTTAGAHLVSWAVASWANSQGNEAMFVHLPGFGGPGHSWWNLALANTHTGSPVDMLATSGAAIAVIGLLFLLVPPRRHLQSMAGRVLRRTGAAALTVYTVHVILTGIATIIALLTTSGELETMPWYVAGVGVLIFHLAVAFGVGALLERRGVRGPLEALVSNVAARVSRAR